MLQRPELDLASKQLLEIADYIDQHGWCQFSYECDNNVCVLGASKKLYNTEHCNGTVRLAKHLGMSVDVWNDCEATSKEQVLDKLREVAYSPVETPA